MDDLVEILKRIEENIEQEVDYTQLCKGLNISGSSLQRIFPVLFNVTLSEYIRKRRLTKAAFELKQTQHSILDIALRYGYESPDAFAIAFKKQHGATPSNVRKGAPMNLFNALKLNLSIEGGNDLPIEIKTLPAFYVAGISIDTKVNSPDISILWKQLSESELVDDLISFSSGKSFGVCYDMQDNGQVKYMAGWEVENPDKVKQLPVEVVLIESSTFAIIPCIGKIPESIHNAWNYMWKQFFPESGYTYSGKFDLEFYPHKVVDSKEYQMQIWVPLEKNN
ncbi:AraC family transcriptional regulator [Planococcus alpniumensis]|uniref:AraC family transcriptional regulator n=1 Tax=Planococcus alpniumensis TaxID=2708345 RepID=UPI001B8AAA3E